MHSVLPAGHIEAHAPLLHTPVSGHTVQPAPQWSMSEATHMPPHETSPDAHAQTPAWQVVPVPQTVPHVPQFWLSVETAMHASPHGTSPPTQMRGGGGSVEVSVAPLSPEPGLDPEPQPRTTNRAEQTTATKARSEKRRPSMSRLLTNGGTSARSAENDATASRRAGASRGSVALVSRGSETRCASLHAPPKSPTRFRVGQSIAWTVPPAGATR
jgi:hypothetical protein